MTPHTERAEAAHAEHGNHGVQAEDDRIPSGKIVFVGVSALVVFFLASAVAVGYLRIREGQHTPVPIPPEIGQSKIGIVEQQIFEVAVRGARDRAQKRQRLESYGWVDRDARIVHVPIERAMDLVAQGVRPAPDHVAPAPTGPGAQP
jgi:hypothetical protein